MARQRRQNRICSQNWKLTAFLVLLAVGAPLRLCAQTAVSLPFVEGFEDSNWDARGWYDSPDMLTTSLQHVSGSTKSCWWRWVNTGDVGVSGRGGRVLLEPSEGLTFSFMIRLSEDWTWSGVGYAPHMFHFLTNADGAYTGPAYTHLTVYAELVDGRLRFALQDGMNIDMAHLNQDLTGVTENRAVAGGNGDSDGYGGKAYDAGSGMYWNGKYFSSDTLCFSDEPGPYYKADWHSMKVHFQLNSVVNGKGVNDGVFQWWYDGRLMMDYHDVLFRTGRFPEMKFNQFIMAPYFGTGVKNSQSAWIDDIRVEREVHELDGALKARDDINGDGRISLLDAIAFMLSGQSRPGDSSLDRNGDGRFDLQDSLAFVREIFSLLGRLKA